MTQRMARALRDFVGTSALRRIMRDPSQSDTSPEYLASFDARRVRRPRSQKQWLRRDDYRAHRNGRLNPAVLSQAGVGR
jgi:hypothetical protein